MSLKLAEPVLEADFYARPVVEVARELIGCTLMHGDLGGVIVETEAYHQSEPACHAYRGPTPRAKTLFAAPGTAYVYFSYGVHSLLNAVSEPEGVGAAVLIRAIAPVHGVEEMIRRRGRSRSRELCSGPGKLTQALGIGLDLNETALTGGPLTVHAPVAGSRRYEIASSPRIGISSAVELPWRFYAVGVEHVSRPR